MRVKGLTLVPVLFNLLIAFNKGVLSFLFLLPCLLLPTMVDSYSSIWNRKLQCTLPSVGCFGHSFGHSNKKVTTAEGEALAVYRSP